MADLTTLQIQNFLIVSIAIMSFIVLLSNVIKAIKDFKRPSVLSSEWQKSIDEKLDKDNKRLATIETGLRLVIKSIHITLNYIIHNEDKEKLDKLQQELTDYLINR